MFQWRRLVIAALSSGVGIAAASGCIGGNTPRDARDGGIADGGPAVAGADGGSGETADGGASGASADGGVGSGGGSWLSASSLAAGNDFTCAVDLSGNAYCWGSAGAGQLGYAAGISDSSAQPVLVPLPGPASRVVAGGYHACALLADGSVACWGTWSAGPQGVSRVAGLPRLLQLAAGSSHTCGLDADGQTWCWGSNMQGQLGRAIGADTDAGKVQTAVRFAQVAAGGDRTCGLALNLQDIYCWGDGQATPTFELTFPAGLRGIGVWEDQLCYWNDRSFSCNKDTSNIDRPPTRIIVGWSNTCYLLSGGSLVCDGANDVGQRGVGYRGSPPGGRVPVDETVSAGGPYVDVAIGSSHICALEQGGAVRCWGNNREGELGIGEDPSHKAPLREVAVGRAKKVIFGSGHVCALLADGTIRCWGSNEYFALGVVEDAWGTHYDSSIPRDPGIVGATDLTVVDSTSCALVPSDDSLGDDDVICWGLYGSPTDQETFSHRSPGGHLSAIYAQIVWETTAAAFRLRVQALTTEGYFYDGIAFTSAKYATVSVGRSDRHSCGLDFQGQAWCWGNNSNGQLGNGQTDGSASPVRVDMPVSAFRQIGVGLAHSCAIDTQGRAWCWGRGAELGDGIGVDESRPVPVVATGPFDRLWVGGRVEEDASCLHSSGGWSCFGASFPSATPTLVPELAELISFSGGDRDRCGLDAQSAVWCSGYDYSGQLGDGITLQSSTPRLVIAP
jgi:alpha-tubulin suppressor-like RCC1 family protein